MQPRCHRGHKRHTVCPGVRSALQHLEWDGGMEQRQIAHHLSSADKAAEIHCPQESSGSAITLRFISTIHSRSVFPPSQVTSRGCKLALSALCFPKATLNSSPFLPLSYYAVGVLTAAGKPRPTSGGHLGSHFAWEVCGQFASGFLISQLHPR